MESTNATFRSNFSQQEGFSFSYYCGDYKTSVAFSEGDCDQVVRNFFYFMLGSGFTPSNVTERMVAIGEEHAEANLSRPLVDPEIANKWNIQEGELVNA
jgi:hypothetical protein